MAPSCNIHPGCDVAIVGAGPAGLALAARSLVRGARIAIVDPRPDAAWTPTWCAFADDLPADVPVAQRWEGAWVHLDDRSALDPRTYVQVDGPALQSELRQKTASARRVLAKAASRVPGGVRLADGSMLPADIVVDCSGGAQVLGGAGPATAYQKAWGIEIETDGHPWDPEQAVWMDLRSLGDPPSFLYVLPRDRTRVFVEETSLAARPAVSLARLELHLAQRLDRLGVVVKRVHGVERCAIPLDVGEPSGPAFGAAGGMIHPATGYLLSRVLAGAEPMAAALERGEQAALDELDRQRGGRARGLHLLGLDVLCRASGADLAAFFDRFFALPASAREAFLAVHPTLGSTTLAMGRLFLDAPLPLKRRLAAPLFSAPAPRPEVACPHS